MSPQVASQRRPSYRAPTFKRRRYRRVLCGTALAACLLTGFILTAGKIPLRAPRLGLGGNAELLARSAAVLPGLNPESQIPNPGHGSAAQPRLIESYGRLPLSFEINRGQTDSEVKFLSRGSDYSLFLTGNEAVLALKKPGVRSGKLVAPSFRAAHPGGADLAFRSAAFPGLLRSPGAELETSPRTADPKTGSALQGLVPDAESQPPTVLRMKLVGANPEAKVSGLEELPGKSNYFIGNDPKKWRTNVPNYAKVKYANVYPGVDLVYYGDEGKLEYDFVVQPGADPRSIELAVVSDGQVGSRQKAVGSQTKASSMASPLRLDANGDLVVGTDEGEVIFHKPVVYQPSTSYEPGMKNQERTTKNREPRATNKEVIHGNYALKRNRVTFEVASYDKTRPLVIDPTQRWPTPPTWTEVNKTSRTAAVR